MPNVTARLKAIKPEHVGAAVTEIQRAGFPPAHAAKQYHLMFNGAPYPQKFVASLATRYASENQLHTHEFSASQSRPILESLGFEIRSVEPDKFIAGEIISELYFFGKEVYEKHIKLKDALAQLSMHHGSARDYLKNYGCLREGKRYTRTMNAEATEYFLKRIWEDEGVESLCAALQALTMHLNYYDKLGNAIQRQIYDLRVKYSALAIDNNVDPICTQPNYPLLLHPAVPVSACHRQGQHPRNSN